MNLFGQSGGGGNDIQLSMNFLKVLVLLSIAVNSCKASAISPVVQNLARGSFLKCVADLTGGLVRAAVAARGAKR